MNKEALITRLSYVLHDNIDHLTWIEARRAARAALETIINATDDETLKEMGNANT